MKKDLKTKRTGFQCFGVIFHQPFKASYWSIRTLKTIRQLGWEPLQYLPYSPDLSAYDFHLFSNFKELGIRAWNKFSWNDKLKNERKWLRTQDKDFHVERMKKVVFRWEKYVLKNKNYTESNFFLPGWNVSRFIVKFIFFIEWTK